MWTRWGSSSSAPARAAVERRPPDVSRITTLTRSIAASLATRPRRVVDIASKPRRIRSSHMPLTSRLSSPATRTRTGRSRRTSATGRLQRELLADGDPAPRRGAGGQLERRARAAAAGHAPRPQRLDDLAHGELAVDEHDVDREAHEEHVHRV